MLGQKTLLSRSILTESRPYILSTFFLSASGLRCFFPQSYYSAPLSSRSGVFCFAVRAHQPDCFFVPSTKYGLVKSWGGVMRGGPFGTAGGVRRGAGLAIKQPNARAFRAATVQLGPLPGTH